MPGLAFRRRDGKSPAPFVAGVPRSGTTLLRLMLDAHPQLAIPPETHFVPELIKRCKGGATPEELVSWLASLRRWADFNLEPGELERRLASRKRQRPGAVLRTFYGLYAERQDKPRWGDKTPGYLKKMPLIERALPEARFVHVIRDGRDAAVSRGSLRLKSETPPTEKVARRWRRQVLKGRAKGHKVEHYMEVRYEDLVTEPEAALRRICDFIELDFDPAMLSYHERAEERLSEIDRDLRSEGNRPHRPAGSRMQAHALTHEPPRSDRIGRWRTEMESEDRAIFDREAGDLLAELGYDVVGASRLGSA